MGIASEPLKQVLQLTAERTYIGMFVQAIHNQDERLFTLSARCGQRSQSLVEIRNCGGEDQSAHNFAEVWLRTSAQLAGCDVGGWNPMPQKKSFCEIAQEVGLALARRAGE